MASAAPPVSAAVESIHRSLSDICSTDHDSFENSRQFSGFSHRLQLLLNLLLRSSSLQPEKLPVSIQTALKGISGDLSQAAETVSVYRKRSKIFVLINCQSLCAALQERTTAIAAWLALIESSLQTDDNHLPELRKKIADLAVDMKHARFRVNTKMRTC